MSDATRDAIIGGAIIAADRGNGEAPRRLG